MAFPTANVSMGNPSVGGRQSSSSPWVNQPARLSAAPRATAVLGTDSHRGSRTRQLVADSVAWHWGGRGRSDTFAFCPSLDDDLMDLDELDMPPDLMEESKKKKNGFVATLVELLSINFSVGSLVATPFAVASSGWIAFIVIPLMGFTTWYTSIYLVKCMQSVDDPEILQRKSYADIALATIGRRGKVLVACLQFFGLIAYVVIYLIIAATSFSALVSQVGFRVWVVVLGCAIMPFTWLKTLHEIAILAMLGLMCLMTATVTVIIASSFTASEQGEVPTDIVKFPGLFVGFSILFFTFAGHEMVPPLARNMRDRKQWPLMAACNYIVVVSYLMVLGVVGFIAFNNGVQENVLFNLPRTAWYTRLCLICVIVNLVMILPIPLNPLCLALEAALHVEKLRFPPFISRVVLRTPIVIFCLLLAILLPYLSSLLALCTAFSDMALTLMLPVFFYWRLYGDRVGRLEKCFMAFVMFLGFFGFVIGIVFGGLELITNVTSRPNPFENFVTDPGPGLE